MNQANPRHPRPETEHVIEKVLELVAANKSWTGETPVAPRTNWGLERRVSPPAILFAGREWRARRPYCSLKTSIALSRR